MTEDEAEEIVRSSVPRETFDRLSAFVKILIDEARCQNLISAASIAQVWSRHILDSLQLVKLAPEHGSWVDIGSGGGLPGLVVGIVRHQPTYLVEPRSKRAAFLHATVERLFLDHVRVESIKVERLQLLQPASVISARAVAPLPLLLDIAHHLSSPETLWLLPKGQSAVAEVASVAGLWHGDLELVPSLTDSHAALVVGRGIERGRRR